MSEPGGSLFAAVGGDDGVSRIVEAFYRRVEADAVLRPVSPEDLGPGTARLKLFLVQWLGGPGEYSEKYGHPRLRMRHFPFVIDERGVGRWLRNMREAWREENVPEDAQAVVFERLAPLAKHMMNATDDVPRTPLTDARLT